MEYTNLDKLKAFGKMKKVAPFDVRNGLTAERVADSNISVGGGLTFNWAALPVSEELLDVMQNLADEAELSEKYRALLAGTRMNTGENRLVLHQLTRGHCLNITVEADGEEKGDFYGEQLKKIEKFANDVRSGKILGSTGKRIDTVVQIGIGGSDLGPRALYLALENTVDSPIKAKFISNVDPDDGAAVIAGVNPETSLFILVSKSGTTLETLTNQLFVAKLIKKKCPAVKVAKHFVAVTSKTSPIAHSKQFRKAFFIDDYIGGRYSSTSAVGGVVLSLALGFETFAEILKGAHQVDMAALEDDITRNAPLFDALAGVYMRNVLNLPSTAVLPYSQALSRFPAHLQQLDMESNGKSVNRFGEEIRYKTGPVIFGEPGTNGQHSFYQLLHQGTDIVPLQFIGFSKSQLGEDIRVEGSSSQKKLIANLVAQIVAFARGKDDENPNKAFRGGRYSSLIYGNKLTPKALGALLAHYENKVMFQGFLWNINSFDQEGVQLGKKLAKKVLSGCEGDAVLAAYNDLF